MTLRKRILAALLFLLCVPAVAVEKVDYASAFGQRQGCFVIADLSTGKIIEEYNPKRCAERFSPCSSFKITATLMAFESNILKDDNQVIKWDGATREREELNRDQTPYSWMGISAKWVTEWITPQLGRETIEKYLKNFSYGNHDFSGDIKMAWQTSTLKISADEQVQFLRSFWLGSLPLSKRTVDLTKNIIFIRHLAPDSDLYSKTGTGCIEGHSCDKAPGGPMLGWFVGVVIGKNKSYVFAANSSDTVTDPQDRAAGPRLRETVIDLLHKLGIAQ